MLYRDLTRIAWITGLALVAGWLSGYPLTCLAVAVVGYTAWLHVGLYALLKWMRDHKRQVPPDTPGVFEELTLEIDRLRERHKKRKKKLGNYLKQFREATRALPDATVVLDRSWAVAWANGAAQRFLGVRWPEDARQRITNLVRLPELHDFLERPDHDTSLEIPCPVDPTVHLSVRVAPFGDGQWLFVARDVTTLHRADQIRRDFVANVSHELRTPITVIRGYLENFAHQPDHCPETWVEPLEQMFSHTQRMHSLVEDLLLLSRLDQGKGITDAQPIAVAEMLSDIRQQACALESFRDQLFRLEIDPDLVIRGEATELYSAFSNLVFNAVAHTPERAVIRIRWYRDAEGAHMEVTDYGDGIAAHHLSRITERFYRVEGSRSRSLGGTGLGLAIVKHVLLRHDATLYIASTPGKGSTFRCDFPADTIFDTAALAMDESA